ncbi:DUF6643 family protein [Streptomyces ochraceiscleroticus]|uniref:DUF6643 family protein n=1 Tax=Streptomyces ochraceiscleroticus TaxID=47761 RepID=A0ABW1MQT0_9ACTN|nr:DUF6643 family protein [Streptomyces ochraceiscleroticus]
MTSPRSTYGGGYYASPSFPDTPIYDSLVAERGTPQIAPIRVQPPYDVGSSQQSYSSPALPALPALPSGPSAAPAQHGYQGQAPMQPAPTPYIPQQAAGPQGYPGQQQPRRPMSTGYEAMRPAAPVAPRPAPYEDPYGRPQHPRGY